MHEATGDTVIFGIGISEYTRAQVIEALDRLDGLDATTLNAWTDAQLGQRIERELGGDDAMRALAILEVLNPINFPDDDEDDECDDHHSVEVAALMGFRIYPDCDNDPEFLLETCDSVTYYETFDHLPRGHWVEEGYAFECAAMVSVCAESDAADAAINNSRRDREAAGGIADEMYTLREFVNHVWRVAEKTADNDPRFGQINDLADLTFTKTELAELCADTIGDLGHITVWRDDA